MIQFSQKSNTFVFSAILIVLILLEAVLGTSVSAVLNSNIAFEESILPIIWDLFVSVLQFAWFWIGYGFLLADWKLDDKSILKCHIGIFCIGTALKSLISLIVGCLLWGFEDFLTSLWYCGLDILFGYLLLACFFGIVRLYFEKKQEKSSFKTPSMIASLVPAIVRILSRIYYDVFFYGVPTSTVDLLWMIFYYVCDILCIFAGYYLILFILSWIEKRSMDSTESIK